MIDQQQILEDLKKLLKDLEQFFTVTLQKERLKKDTNHEKDRLYSRVKESLAKLTEDDEEEQEEYVDVSLGAQPDDSDMIYDDTAPTLDMPDAISHSGSQKSLENDDENDEDMTYAGTTIRPFSVAELGFTSKEGILDKKRKDGQFGFSQWQSRYCLIKDNIMYYYKTKTDHKQCNEINLSGYEASSSPDLEKRHKRKQFLFVVNQPGSRSFQFIAQSQDNMMSWVDEINKASKLCPKPESAKLIAGETASMGSGNGEDFGDEYEDLDEYQKFKIGHPGLKGADDKKIESVNEDDFGDEYEDLDDYQMFKIGQGPRPANRPVDSSKPNVALEPANEDADFGDEYEDLDDYQKMKIGAPVAPKKVEDSNADFGGTYDDVSVTDTPHVPPLRELPSKPVERQSTTVSVQSQGSASGVIEFDEQSDDDCGDIYEEVEGQKANKPKKFGNSVIHSPLPAPPGQSSARSSASSQKLPALPGTESKKQNVIPVKEPWEEDIKNIYISMWDCKADERNELDFKRGDLIHILSQEYDGWWVGEKNYKVGLVPQKYLMKAYM